MADPVDALTKALGPLGAEVMDVLWSSAEPMTVRRVMGRLNEDRRDALAYTTVMTVLARLADRGAAARTRVGRGFVYAPAVTDVAELAVHDVVQEHGEAAVAHFVDHARADPRLRRRLERLLSGPGPDRDTAPEEG